MTFPTGHEDNATSVGPTNVKHPIITFQVIKNRNTHENVGPITNSRNVSMLHPDRHNNSADAGRVNSENHITQLHLYLPGFQGGSNITRNDNGTFTAYGQEAVYLKQRYADIANPYLLVTNSAPYTSA